MILDFLKRLNEPFPSQKSLRSSLFGQFYVALFIAGFLVVFKPFGMSGVPSPLLLSLAFGAVSLLFSASFDLFCRLVLKIKTDMPSWTLWKWLLQSFLMVSWIAFGNHTLQSILFWGGFGSIDQWLDIWQATLTLGSIPIFVSGLMIQLQAIKSNVQQAAEIELPSEGHAHGPDIEFALSSSQPLFLSAADLLFVEAMQNYVLMHLREGNAIGQYMVRNTLVDTLQKFQSTGAKHIVRCHRSFLVNIEAIDQVSGNAQGLKLKLNSLPNTVVPVSRSYIPEFKGALERVVRPSTL